MTTCQIIHKGQFNPFVVKVTKTPPEFVKWLKQGFDGEKRTIPGGYLIDYRYYLEMMTYFPNWFDDVDLVIGEQHGPVRKWEGKCGPQIIT